MTVKADQIGQQGLAEHRDPRSFFFQNDLQQDGTGQVLARLGVPNEYRFMLHDQPLDFCQRHIRRGDGVVKTPVGVFLDDPRWRGRGGGRRHG